MAAILPWLPAWALSASPAPSHHRACFFRFPDPSHGVCLDIQESMFSRLDRDPVLLGSWIEGNNCWMGHSVSPFRQPDVKHAPAEPAKGLALRN